MPVHRPVNVPRAVGALAAGAVLLAAGAAEAARPAAEGTGGPATGTVQVNSGYSLSVREAPRSSARKVRSVADGATVKIVCQTRGQRVTGRFGTSTTWDRLAKGGYVSDTFVYTGSDGRVAPDCEGGGTPEPKPTPEPEPEPKGWPKDLKRASDPATYDDSPPWKADKSSCTPGFTRGAKLMQGWLRASYGRRMTIGGYSCRQNTADLSRTSIHGVGRANDWFRDAGDPAEARDAASFIRRMSANGGAMAHAMGVQYFIWNRQEYHVGSGGITVDSYGGPNPHTDHVHIELNVKGGQARSTYWKKAIRAGRR